MLHTAERRLVPISRILRTTLFGWPHLRLTLSISKYLTDTAACNLPLTPAAPPNKIYSGNHGGHVALCRMYIILVADPAVGMGSAGREVADDRMQIWYPVF